MAHLSAHRRLAVRQQVRPVAGLPQVGGAALLALVVALAWAGATGAPGVPFSDESGHMAQALSLAKRWGGPPGTRSGVLDLLRPNTSYPPLYHALVQPLLGHLPGLLPFRAVAASLVVLHAAVALALGPRLWGHPATWAYVALACGGPVLLSMSTLAFVDGPSAALCGIAILLLLRSDGFRVPWASMGFAVATAAALYTKWTVILFLGPPVAWELARSVGITARRPLPRGALLLGLAALSAALAAGVWFGGADPAWQRMMRDPRRALPFDGPILAGLGLVGLVGAAAGWPLAARRLLVPSAVAAAALVAITLLAGPWYVGAHADLLHRLAHESGQLAQRQARVEVQAETALTGVGDLVPMVSVAIALGLPFALTSLRRMGQAAAAACGGIGGLVVVLATLPPDLRYLLPAAPLLASAAASLLGRAPKGIALPVALVVLVGQVGPSLPMLETEQPLTAEGRFLPGGSAIAHRLPQPWPPLPVGRVLVPDPLPPEQVERLVEAVRQHTGQGRQSVLVLEGTGQAVQGRGLSVLADLSGFHLQAIDGRWERPLPEIAPEQWVLAPACDGTSDPAPVERFAGQWGWCDLGLFQGAAPVPAPPPRPPPVPPTPPS